MSKQLNLLLIIGVIVIIALPLWMVRNPSPGTNGKKVEIFRGTDDQARDVIGKVAPEYKPWFKPLLEPSDGATGSLLFTLQAALGAGFIGYYFGVSATRAKLRRKQNGAEC